jgi:hypothetical protein
MDGLSFDDIEVDVTRTRNNSVDALIAGKWQNLEFGPAGTDDDHGDNNDEFIAKNEDHPGAYSFDGPGFHEPQGSNYFNSKNATEAVMTANFIEWVRFTEKFTGNVINDPTVINWCVQVYLKKENGKWKMDLPNNFIKTGTTKVGYP